MSPTRPAAPRHAAHAARSIPSAPLAQLPASAPLVGVVTRPGQRITRPGLWRLAATLHVPRGLTGLVVDADDVTLDLEGSAMIGEGDGIGIEIRPRCHDVVIRNGIVSGFAVGVRALPAGTAAADLALVDLRVTSCTRDGIQLDGVQGATLDRVLVSDAARDGLRLRGAAVVVRDSTLSANRGHGLVADGGELTVERSHLSRNLDGGLAVTGDVVGVIAGNRLFGNRGPGLRVAPAARDLLVADNVAARNGRDAVTARPAAPAALAPDSPGPRARMRLDPTRD